MPVAACIGGIFFVTMAASALLMDLVLTALGLVTAANPDVRAQVTRFGFDCTFWLNLVFGALAAGLAAVNRKHPNRQFDHARQRPVGVKVAFGPRR